MTLPGSLVPYVDGMSATTIARPGPARHRAEAAASGSRGLLTVFPFALCHVAVLGVLWSGVTWQAAATGVALYWVRMFGVTAGYHRYFAHRTFSTSRVMQLVLALLAQSTAQKGVLWWASHHRAHHLYSDSERDPHSPRQRGFFHAHVGWLWRGTDRTDWNRVRDLVAYPELVWLDRHFLVPPTVLAIAVLLTFGWSGLFVGFFASTVLTWHATFFINSLAHVWGSRRFDTNDGSRNNALLALLTLGEGWHNNHHHDPRSARQGLAWWELDPTYAVLCVMERLGLVWDVKRPAASRRVRASLADVNPPPCHTARSARLCTADPRSERELVRGGSQVRCGDAET